MGGNNMVKKVGASCPSIQPNPENYIPRKDEFERLRHYIDETNGSVIGISGVRGSGKTTVMDKLIDFYKSGNYFTLKITSPTGYDEEKFFITIFKRLCENVSNKLEKELGIKPEIEERVKKERWKYVPLYILLVILPLIILIIWVLSYYFTIPDTSVILSSPPPIEQILISYIVIVPFIILLIRFFSSPLIRSGNKKKVGLYLKTLEILEALKYEKTLSYEAEAKVGVVKQLSAAFKSGKELKTREISLPGLTSMYRDYVDDVLNTFEIAVFKENKIFYPKGKLIICIDELDKITDPEDVKKLLRGIKGVIFQPNCYYFISISEDAVRSFKTRISTSRDMIESTFDEIIYLDRINLSVGEEIVKKWYPNKDIISIGIMIVYSGGIPRELIRNITEIFIEAKGKMDIPKEIIDKFKRIYGTSTRNILTTWKVIFDKKIYDFKKEIKFSNIDERNKMDILEFLEKLEIDDLSNNKINAVEEINSIYNLLYDLYVEIKEKSLNEIDKDERKVLLKDIDKLLRSLLEIKVGVVIFNFINTGNDYNEDFFKILLKACSILPDNRSLAKKLIRKAINLEIPKIQKPKAATSSPKVPKFKGVKK
jgi:hypothetical protein